jgi:hypothetical protein
VAVHVQTYEPAEIPGAASHVVAGPGSQVLEFWRSEQLNVVIDGRQHLLALLSPDLGQVYQAFWSQSLYVSSLLHGGMSSEQTIHKLLQMLDDERTPAELADAIRAHRFFLNSDIPGQKELLARFAGDTKPS